MTAPEARADQAGTSAGLPTLGQRLTAALLIAALRLLRVLPEGLVYRGAFAIGRALSVPLRSRRRLVRANLERVVRWLDATGGATSPAAAAAARDPRALDRLVRDVFGHWVTTYAESALAPRYDAAALRSRVRLETPEAVERAVAPVPAGRPGILYVGMHFGAVELAGLYAARTGHVPVGGPMETIANPAVQAYFERTRRALGVEVVPLRDAAGALRARLAAGLGVGLVADRPIGGSGSRVQLFGSPGRLPAGPSVLAVQTGARLCFLSLRREARPGRWVGRLEEVAVPREGTERERVRALLDEHARWIERTVARAPEQWWTLLFPVWEDIR
jgi:KDO2-lipid IV(A) lauroyltransferase